jgi:glycosyltransferase involved in cell wall biosynthesis
MTDSNGYRRIVLVSNCVMHYRISVYNYFYDRFRELGYDLAVIADRVQWRDGSVPRFELQEVPFCFNDYRRAIRAADPAAVILFLRLKDSILWPLIHWLKLRAIRFAVWTKAGNWDYKRSMMRYELFNYVHGMSDAVIVYSEACRALVKPRYHGKTFVANNTINFGDFPAVHERKEEIRKEYGIPFKKVVIFVGRMSAERGRKRVEDLIEAFRTFETDDCGLVLVGSGLRAELERRLEPRNTVYLGEVQDSGNRSISRLCRMADLCVIPGHVGLAINQAFYWGLPVVTEEGTHPPEFGYLKPGRNGLVVPQGDVVALRNAIRFLLENDDLRAEMSRNAREDILREASIEGMFGGFRRCVDHLVAMER